MSLRFEAYKPSDDFRPTPIRVLDFPCYHCGRTMRVPATSAEDAEAAYWRERYDGLMGSLNQALSDVRQRFGVDPMAIMLAERLIALRERMRLPEQDGPG